MVRSLIEEDVDAGKSTTLGRYKSKSKGEETNSMSPTRLKKLEIEEKGVDEKLEKLKELLAELKSQTGTQTSMRTFSPFTARIQEETILKNS